MGRHGRWFRANHRSPAPCLHAASAARCSRRAGILSFTLPGGSLYCATTQYALPHLNDFRKLAALQPRCPAHKEAASARPTSPPARASPARWGGLGRAGDQPGRRTGGQLRHPDAGVEAAGAGQARRLTVGACGCSDCAAPCSGPLVRALPHHAAASAWRTKSSRS